MADLIFRTHDKACSVFSQALSFDVLKMGGSATVAEQEESIKKSRRKEIGARLRQALEAQGITLRELGRRLGKKSSGPTSDWCKGNTQPSLEELAQIVEMTECSADWIIGVTDAQPHALKDANQRAAQILRKTERLRASLERQIAQIDKAAKK